MKDIRTNLLVTEGGYEAIWAWTAWWMSSSQFDCMLFVFRGSDNASGWAQMLKAINKKAGILRTKLHFFHFSLCFQSVCVFLCTCVERWVAYVGRGRKCDGDGTSPIAVDPIVEFDMWRSGNKLTYFWNSLTCEGLWIVVLRQRTVYEFKLCLLLSFFVLLLVEQFVVLKSEVHEWDEIMGMMQLSMMLCLGFWNSIFHIECNFNLLVFCL